MIKFAFGAGVAALVAWLTSREARDRGIVTTDASQIVVAAVVGALAFRCLK